jgi:hypothetical protein
MSVDVKLVGLASQIRKYKGEVPNHEGPAFDDYKMSIETLFRSTPYYKILKGTNEVVPKPVKDRLSDRRAFDITKMTPKEKRENKEDVAIKDDWEFYDNYILNQNSAYFLLVSTISTDGDAFSYVRDENAKDSPCPARLWKELNAKYQRSSAAAKVREKKKIMQMQIADNEAPLAFINRLKRQRITLESTGAKVIDEDMRLYLMMGLSNSEKYEQLCYFYTLMSLIL